MVCLELLADWIAPDGIRAWYAIQEFPYYPGYAPAVMDDVFVVGYPWGLSGGTKALPLFKRGSIASEPTIEIDGLPKFLIDCRTASGMSGSPVIGQRHGVGHNGDVGSFQGFVGVYSGRLETNGRLPSEADTAVSEIGVVWRRSVIDEIIDSGQRGTKLSDLLK